jgi:hypothetical protein
MCNDISKLSDRIELLAEQVDSINEKLAGTVALLERIDKALNDLPSLDELEDMSKEASSILHSFEAVKTSWMDDKMPSLDALNDYACIVSDIADGLKTVA